VQLLTVLPTETFNLTVENEHVYYANGILVANCLTYAAPVRVTKAELPMGLPAVTGGLWT
jgi:hypothetical protein